MGPFDDQGVIDLIESGTYTATSGSSSDWSEVGLQETGASTVVAGLLSLVAREARITKSITATPTRPREGGTYTADDGLVWQIVSVVKRGLANFWEITGRTFNVPGGLTVTGQLSRRTNTADAVTKLSDPAWPVYATVNCAVIPGSQDIEFTGDEGTVTTVRAQVIAEGRRDIRAGDNFALTADPDTLWTVTSVEPYDLSLGAQVFQTQRRI